MCVCVCVSSLSVQHTKRKSTPWRVHIAELSRVLPTRHALPLRFQGRTVRASLYHIDQLRRRGTSARVREFQHVSCFFLVHPINFSDDNDVLISRGVQLFKGCVTVIGPQCKIITVVAYSKCGAKHHIFTFFLKLTKCVIVPKIEGIHHLFVYLRCTVRSLYYRVKLTGIGQNER